MVPHCGFFLCFSDNEWCWASFQVFVSHLYVFFWRRQWQATPVLLPRKSHGWRSLVGYSPWGRHESVATERLHFHFSLSRNGEGNGSPLQYSCLGNPMARGAWWATVHEVTKESDTTSWLNNKQQGVAWGKILWTEGTKTLKQRNLKKNFSEARP